MFARLLGRKKNQEPAKTRDELKAEKILHMTVEINKKIKVAEQKANALSAKRAKLMKEAKKYQYAKDAAALKRLLLNVKSCDENIKRQTAISLKLDKMRDTCEAYLDQSDFMESIRDASVLIEQFALKPEEAEQLMDRMQELADVKNDVDEVMNEGLEEGDDDLDDLMAELDNINEDGEVVADEPLPSVPSAAPKSAAKTNARAKPVNEYDNLEAELEDL